MERHGTREGIMKRSWIGVLLVTLVALPTMKGAPAARAQFPGKNGLIAFAAETPDEGSQLFTVRHDGHGLRQITDGPAQASSPDWAPNGAWIAYTRNDCHVALIRPDGTAGYTIRSGNAGGCDADPAFTPDGEHLVFERQDDADDAAWIMDLHGDGRRRIGNANGGATTPEVSPDGSTVTVLSSASNGLNALFAIPIEGGAATQITPTLFGITFKHDWAPNGGRLVMSDNADDPDHTTNVVTFLPDGTGARYLTHNTAVSEHAYAGGYSPNGKWVVYREEHGDQSALMIVRTDGQGAHIVLPFSSLRPRFIDWGPS